MLGRSETCFVISLDPKINPVGAKKGLKTLNRDFSNTLNRETFQNSSTNTSAVDFDKYVP